MTAPALTFATNNGDVGGGEVMLLLLARAAAELGVPLRVVGPRRPDDLVRQSAAAGHDTVVLDADDRRGYMRALRSWDRSEREGILWCNGLLPATATAGHRRRVVHLHQPPVGAQRLARRIATHGATEVVVPSSWMAARVPHTIRLANWTDDLDFVGPRDQRASTIGFMGRLTREKGVDVLGRAVATLVRRGLDPTVVIAGEQRFGSDRDARAIRGALEPVEHLVQRIGWVEPADFFAQIDVAVFPSVWPEPFGLVAAEAMSYGVPFVVSDSGALPEVVGPRHPWLARHGDADDLADVVARALAATSDEVIKVAKAGRTRWEQEFSPAVGREHLGDVLRRLGLEVG